MPLGLSWRRLQATPIRERALPPKRRESPALPELWQSGIHADFLGGESTMMDGVNGVDGVKRSPECHQSRLKQGKIRREHSGLIVLCSENRRQK